jgi:hypothetical protein
MAKRDLNIEQLFETLVEIHGTTKRKEKDALMLSLKDSKLAYDFFSLAVDKRINLWVTAPELGALYFKGKKTLADFEKRWETFKKLYEALRSRKITGSAAIQATTLFITSCSNEAPTFEATWYAGAIDRHLNIGVSSASLRKIWPDLVSDFAVQLAESLYDQKTMTVVSSVAKDVQYPCVDEPKLDGLNISIVGLLSNKTCMGFSRANKPFPAFQAVYDAYLDVLKQAVAKGLVPGDFVLNGEVKAALHKDDPKNWKSSWGKTNALCHAGIKAEGFDIKHIDDYSKTCIARDLTITLYNCYPVASYATGTWDVRYGNVNDKGSRSWLCAAFAKAIMTRNPGIKVNVIEQRACNNLKELKAAHKYWISQKAEGSMIKSCTGICELERGTHFIKWKQYRKFDAIIIGVKRGNGKYSETGGTLTVYMPKNKGTALAIADVTCRTEDERNWAWQNRFAIAGYSLEVVEDAGDDDVASTRNPILARFRNDVPPKTLEQMLKLVTHFKDHPKLKGVELPKKQLSAASFNKVTASFNL